MMTTYWCEPTAAARTRSDASTAGSEEPEEQEEPEIENCSHDVLLIDEGLERLVDWNVDVFQQLLKAPRRHRYQSRRLPA
jgi:hypothetical protein